MEEESLCTSLSDKIRSKTDAEEIIRVFYELYGGLSPRHLFCHRRLFLRSATEHDHTELRVLLLANTHHGDPAEVIRNDEPSDTVHTIESDHEIVKLLLSRDLHEKQEGVRRLLSADPTTFKAEQGRVNPLECFIRLGGLFYKRKLSLALPEIVQYLIDSGADVVSHLSFGGTPLDYLMIEVQAGMRTDDVDIAREGRHVILETTRILLEAGSRLSRRYAEGAIFRLMAIHVLDSNLLEVRESSLQCKLISALYELLLKHIDITNASDIFEHVLTQASLAAYGFIAIAGIPGCLKHCNSIMGSFTHILRCIYSSARDIVLPDTFLYSCTFFNAASQLSYRDFRGALMHVFQSIANYASVPGASTSLIRLVLSILNASEKVNLRRSLENCVNVSRALMWLNDEIELPYRLEYLAGYVVTRPMSASMGRVRVDRVLGLGLPDCIAHSLLLTFDF